MVSAGTAFKRQSCRPVNVLGNGDWGPQRCKRKGQPPRRQCVTPVLIDRYPRIEQKGLRERKRANCLESHILVVRASFSFAGTVLLKAGLDNFSRVGIMSKDGKTRSEVRRPIAFARVTRSIRR